MLTPEELVAIASQPVHEQQGIYVCMDCGKLNTYWVYSCEDCDMEADIKELEARNG